MLTIILGILGAYGSLVLLHKILISMKDAQAKAHMMYGHEVKKTTPMDIDALDVFVMGCILLALLAAVAA